MNLDARQFCTTHCVVCGRFTVCHNNAAGQTCLVCNTPYRWLTYDEARAETQEANKRLTVTERKE